MDYTAAITRNRDALLRLVALWSAALAVMAGGTITRRAYFAVAQGLRSAESALRRLIIIEARDLAQRAYARRTAPKGPIPKGDGAGKRLPPFALFDPRKNFGNHGRRYAVAPRIGFFDAANALGRTGPNPEPTPDDPVDAAALLRRFAVMKAALDDLPRQAKRLRRAQARRSVGPKRFMGPMRPGWPPGTVPRHLHTAALRMLRPLESSLRRLVVMVAMGLSVTLRGKRAGLSGPIPKGTGQRTPSFPLLDTLQRVGYPAPRRSAPGQGPRISFPGYGDDPVFVTVKPVLPDDPMDAARLCRRLLAMQYVLENLPRQARRMARWRAKQKATVGHARMRPLRPGRPPGHRARKRYEVDELLADCHELALLALVPPDTS